MSLSVGTTNVIERHGAAALRQRGSMRMSYSSHRCVRTCLLLVTLATLCGCDTLTSLLGSESEGSSAPVDGSAMQDAGPSALPEAEPNDSLAQAPNVQVGRTYTGSLAPGDIDMLRLGMGAPVSLTLRSTGDAEFFVMSPTDGVRRRYVLMPNLPLTLDAVARETALALEWSGQGEWSIDIQTAAEGVEIGCGFLGEQDSVTAPGAELVALPSVVTGCIEQAGDIDHLVLSEQALAGAPMFGVAVSAVEGVALQVGMRDAGGTLMAELIGGPGEALVIPNVGSPLVPGPVSIQVASLGGASPERPWRLEVRRPPGVLGAVEVEPNDTAASPTLVESMDIINGWLHRPGDSDHYRLTLPETQVVRMLAEAPAGVDLQILLAQQGSFGDMVIDAETTAQSESLCSVRVGPDVPFEFSIRASGTETTGASPYILHFDRYSGVDFEVEPNDLVEQLPVPDPMAVSAAGLDSLGSRPVQFVLQPEQMTFTAAGHVFPDNDRDHFLLYIAGDRTANVTYTSVTLRLEPGATADLVMELLDDRGALIARADSGTVGVTETAAIDLSSGRYVVRVSRMSGRSCEQPYRLFADLTAIPPSGQVEDGSGVAPAEGSEGSAWPEVPVPDGLVIPTTPNVEPGPVPDVPPRPGTAPSVPARPGGQRLPVPDVPPQQGGSPGSTLPPRPGEGAPLQPRP
jgi:hypothetical protein